MVRQIVEAEMVPTRWGLIEVFSKAAKTLEYLVRLEYFPSLRVVDETSHKTSSIGRDHPKTTPNLELRAECGVEYWYGPNAVTAASPPTADPPPGTLLRASMPQWFSNQIPKGCCL